MADVSGQRQTGNIAASQRVVEMDKPIHLLEPSATPLVVFTGRLKGRQVAAKDSTFKWHEDELEVRFDAIDNVAGEASTETELTVATGAAFAPGDLVRVPSTGEVFYVSSISGEDLTVTRGVGGTTAAAMVDTEPLYIIGTADAEGDTSVSARSDNPTAVTNYTQIFKHSVEASGTALSISNESSPHDWPYQAKKQMIEHQKDKELAFLFGGPDVGITDAAGANGPIRATGGVLHYATENGQDESASSITEAEFESFIRGVFRYGSQRKVLFASPLIVSALNQFGHGAQETSAGQTQFGVRVQEWISAHGTLGIVKHNLLEGAEYGGYAFVVDFNEDGVKYRYLNGDGPGGSRDTKLYMNRQENDRDGRKDEIITECGLQFANPKKHGVLQGVTG